MLLSALYPWDEIAISGDRDCNLGMEVSMPCGVEPCMQCMRGGARCFGRTPHMTEIAISRGRDCNLVKRECNLDTRVSTYPR